MQVSPAATAARFTPRPSTAPSDNAAKIADLTQLAVAQTNVKMTAAAGAALGQTSGELAGTLVDISA